MCRATTCRSCGKTTWAGCGRHVEQVLGAVPAAERCPGHEPGSAAIARSGPGLLGRLFTRR